jgi:acyl CoA:acetate/3-ketoacid CoA transferase alpha subunit
MKSKLSIIKYAVDTIQDGSIVAVGGNTNYRHPIALALEIINQEKKNLKLFSMTAGLSCD